MFNGIYQRPDVVLIPQILFQGGTIQPTVCREVLTTLPQFRGLAKQGFQLHRQLLAFRAGRWLDAERHRDFVFSIGDQKQRQLRSLVGADCNQTRSLSSAMAYRPSRLLWSHACPSPHPGQRFSRSSYSCSRWHDYQ